MILTITANAAIDKRYVVNDAKLDAVNRVKSCEPSAGGKGINVSRVATIAGEKVIATGFVGGNAGNYITSEVEAFGITNAFVNCKGESRTCLNIWDEVNKTQTEYLEPGITINDSDMDRLMDVYAEKLEKCDIVTISGSLPSGGTAELYRKMVALGKEKGKKVILDTSGKTLEDCLTSQPYMIKPNMDEIQMLVNKTVTSEEELIKAADELHAMGIPCVVISRGGDGSLMSCEEGVFAAHVPKIDAVNTVGCGDSMIGGFAVGLSRNLPMDECLKLASAVSAASAMRLETGFYKAEDAEDLMPRISIEKIR